MDDVGGDLDERFFSEEILVGDPGVLEDDTCDAIPGVGTKGFLEGGEEKGAAGFEVFNGNLEDRGASLASIVAACRRDWGIYSAN